MGAIENWPGRDKRKLKEIVSPSEMIALGDSSGWRVPGEAWSGFMGLERPGQYPSDLHSDGANILFVDGHVELIKQTLATDTQDDQMMRKWHVDHKP